MILDTTFLVDLQREVRREERGNAAALLERFADEEVGIGFVTWMEFAEGFEDDRREDCGRFLKPFPILWPDVEVSWEASRIVRRLGTALGSAVRRRAARVLARVALVRIDDAVLAAAARVRLPELRTLDAIHVATARSLDGLAGIGA